MFLVERMADEFAYYGDPKDRDTLIMLDRMFRLAVDHPIATHWRDCADVCYKFEHGDQWTNEETKILKDRNQPPIVENEIRPTIERLQGQFRKQRTTIKFLGRNQSDEAVANGLTDVLRHIDYVNQAEFVEGEAIKDQLIGGIGWMEASVSLNELGEQQVRYRREDPFTIFLDPFCRSYDINEQARYICRAKWIEEDDAMALWGEEKAAKIRSVLGTSQPSLSNLSNIDPDALKLRNWEIGRYYDQKNQRFRPVEIWYKKRATEFLIETPEGKTVTVRKEQGVSKASLQDAVAQMPGTVITERSIDQMWVAVYCGGIFLDGPKPSPYRCNLFPFIPYYCYRKIDGEPQGYAWSLLDPQREINARRSKALWALNNRQTIFERNAIRDKAELANELARMDGQIELETGKFDKFMVKENQDISQGNLTMLQETKVAMRRISGEDQMNLAPDIRSGVGLQRLQAQQQAGVLPIYDNIRRSRRLKAKLTFELVKQYYTEDMVFQITEDPNITRTVTFSSSDLDVAKQAIYDLVAVDTVDYSTSQAEQLDMLTTTLPQVIQYGPQWAALLISMSELRNKDGLLKLLENMNQPPPVTVKPSVAFQWNELTQAEKMALAMQFQWQMLAQAEQAQPTEPASITQNKAEILKTQMKAEADVTKAHIAATSAMHDQRVSMENTAMKGMADLHKQEMQNEQKNRDSARAAKNGA